MKKYLPAILLIVILSGAGFIGTRTAFADNGPLGNPIVINPATMTINEKEIGNASKLFDEQSTLQLDGSGNPIQSSTPAGCGSWWEFPVGQRACFMLNDTNGPAGMDDPASVVVNLLQQYKISNIYVYYQPGTPSSTANTFQINSGTPFNFNNVVDTITYNSSSVPSGWVRIPAAQLQTQYLQLVFDTNFPTIQEIVFYGTPVGSAPAAPAPVTPIASNVTFDKFVGVDDSYGMGQSADGTDYDETWGALRSYGGYQYSFDVHDNPIPTDAYTAAFLQRVTTLGINVYDVEQGAALSMEDPNNLPAGTDKVKAIDYTLCQGTTLFDGNLTCIGVADQPSSYAHKAYLTKEAAISDAAEGVNFIEPGNEPDGFWHGAGYYAPYELAAMMSADYDGNCGTVTYNGHSVGVKNSGTSVKMLMPALANYNIDYLNAMEFWFQNHRTCSPTFPADIIGIHVYPTTAGLQFGSSTGVGLPPEDTSFDMRDKVEAVVNFRNKYAPQALVINSEFGYDTYDTPNADPSCTGTYGGSWQAAPVIGPYSVYDVQGQWLTRGLLEGEAEGLDGLDIFWLGDQLPPDQLCGTFDASGMLTVDANPTWETFHPKESWWDVQTLRNNLTGMKFVSETNFASGNGTVRVQKYTSVADATKSAYVVWSPTATAWTTPAFPLSLTQAATTSTVEITSGSVQGTVAATNNSPVTTVTLPVSELPTIVLANSGVSTPPTLTMSASSSQTTTDTTSTVTLTGTESDSSLVSSIAWQEISGPSTGTFAHAAALSTTVSGLAAGSYVFEIDATSTTGAVVTAQTSITVTVTTPVTSGGGGGGGGSTVIISSGGGGGSTTTTGTTSVAPTYDSGCLVGYLFSITDGARCTSANTSPTAATPPIATTTANVLKYIFTKHIGRGSIGTEVVALQKLLISLGLLKGSADGEFGPMTTSALKLFQLEHKLTPDGLAGPITRAALNNS
jgi:hypothetical protein